MAEWQSILRNKLFLIPLAIKILFAFTFGSDYIVKLFIPFINYFVLSGFENPYDFFSSLGMLKAFPYSPAMLFILAIPYTLFSWLLQPDWHAVTALHLILARVPLLLADVAILFVLVRWLKGRENDVLALYWCSPITLYISYFHGQLDAIPIALLMLSLYLLFEKRFGHSALLIGLAISTKANILAAIPFILIFLWKNERSWRATISYLLIALAVFVAFLLPFGLSEGYRKMVVGSDEQAKLFSLILNYGYLDIRLFLAPAAAVAIFFVFSSFGRLNRDILLMTLCLVFISFVAFVPPMPGWYYWSIPFLAFFFIKEETAPRWGYMALWALYITYFVFRADSDIFQSFQIISPQIASMQTPFAYVSSLGIDATLLSNLIFTLFTALMLAIGVWVYKIGIKSNLEYKVRVRPTMVGICGDSSTGKNYLAHRLSELFGESNTVLVDGDDMHKWERGHHMWQIYTHLNPKGSRLHLDAKHAIALKEGREVFRAAYDHSTGKFREEHKVSPNKFIVFCGLHLFYIEKMRSMFDIRIFLQPEEALRRKWKIARDTAERRYSKEDVMAQMEARKPDFARHILPQKKFADITISYAAESEGWAAPSVPCELNVKIWVKNDLDIDSLQDSLLRIGTLKLDYWPEEDLLNTALVFGGSASAQEISDAAYRLVPNLEDLLQNRPQWRGGGDGIVQLFLLYYLSEKSKEKARG